MLDYPGKQRQRQNRKELYRSMEQDGLNFSHLSHYDAITFVIIDPVHNLLLGMARSIVTVDRIWDFDNEEPQ